MEYWQKDLLQRIKPFPSYIIIDNGIEKTCLKDRNGIGNKDIELETIKLEDFKNDLKLSMMETELKYKKLFYGKNILILVESIQK